VSTQKIRANCNLIFFKNYEKNVTAVNLHSKITMHHQLR
jgi:hypothetical protein